MAGMPWRFSSARFVGRDREFARLADALDHAAAGRPTTLLIGAAAGLGASRFLDEATIRIGRLTDPFTVVRCRTTPEVDGIPYGPVLAGLRPLLAGIAGDPSQAGEEIIRRVIGLWENHPDIRERMLAVLRTALSHDHAPRLPRDMPSSSLPPALGDRLRDEPPRAPARRARPRWSQARSP